MDAVVEACVGVESGRVLTLIDLDLTETAQEPSSIDSSPVKQKLP